MSTDKNSHYKLDFKVKSPDGNNYSLWDFAPKYRWENNPPFKAAQDIIDSYIKADKLHELEKFCSLEEFNSKFKDPTSACAYWLDDPQFMEEVKAINSLGITTWYKETVLTSNRKTLTSYYQLGMLRDGVIGIFGHAVKKTPEYMEYNLKFQKWIKLRPGIVRIWEQCHPGVEIGLEALAAERKNRQFRNLLEGSRPKPFPEGSLVKLKDEYLQNRGKDPFYYDYDIRTTKERIGMVTKFQNPDHNYTIGLGSRMVNVHWMATGVIKQIPERCLVILKNEEEENKEIIAP
jgi:hypothetical protein